MGAADAEPPAAARAVEHSTSRSTAPVRHLAARRSAGWCIWPAESSANVAARALVHRQQRRRAGAAAAVAGRPAVPRAGAARAWASAAAASEALAVGAAGQRPVAGRTSPWLNVEPNRRRSAPARLATVALGLLAPLVALVTITRRAGGRPPLVIGAALMGAAATTLSTAMNFGPDTRWPGDAGRLCRHRRRRPSRPCCRLVSPGASRRRHRPDGAVGADGAGRRMRRPIRTSPRACRPGEQGRFIHFHGARNGWAGCGPMRRCCTCCRAWRRARTGADRALLESAHELITSATSSSVEPARQRRERLRAARREGRVRPLQDAHQGRGPAGPGGVRVNKAGCLDRCAGAPVAVVYPGSGLVHLRRPGRHRQRSSTST